MTNFTPEDLLLYLYQETTIEQKIAIENALKNDWSLREKISVLKASIERLDTIKESPRTETILRILNHVRQSAAQEA